MIDPKFDKLPVTKPLSDAEFVDESELSAEEREARLRLARKGVGVNDTIARDANLSVGARGVDVSGVAAGAGAGAGSTFITPSTEGSPAPTIVPGSRGTGVTPRADAPSGETSTDRTRRDE